MARIDFVKEVVRILNLHRGLLTPDKYVNTADNRAGETQWSFPERVLKVYEGHIAMDQRPPFVLVPWRGKTSLLGDEADKVFGDEKTMKLEVPLDPSKNLRESTRLKLEKGEKVGGVNYFPAVALMTDDIWERIQTQRSVEERNLTAGVDFTNWLKEQDNLLDPEYYSVRSVKAAAKEGTYNVLITVYTNGKPEKDSLSQSQDGISIVLAE